MAIGKNNIGTLQEKGGHLPNRDNENAEVFNTFSASDFSMDGRPRRSWP